MRILAFAASLRAASHNRKLIANAAEIARAAGVEVDLADFHEFDMPLYDGDLQESAGLPPGALELVRRIEAADGVMIASPEYNYSIPGVLKNAIDWVSRARPQPLRGRHGMIMAASSGMIGGIRGLWQLRIPLEGLGLMLSPDMFALAQAASAFDGEGRLSDEATRKRLETMIEGYLEMGRRLSTPEGGERARAA